MNSSIEIANDLSVSIIDALTAHVCLLDDTGEIVAVNESWCRFAEANQPVPKNYGIGINYLRLKADDTIPPGGGTSSTDLLNFITGIKKVLNAEVDEFSYDYPCHSPEQMRWFTGRVKRFIREGKVFLVISHENITSRVLAEEELKSSHNFFTSLIEQHQAIAKESLNRSRQEFAHLVENIPVGVYALSTRPNGYMQFHYASSKLSDMIQISEKEILADHMAAFRHFHPEDIEGLRRVNLDRIKEPAHFEWTGRILINGHVKWLHMASTPEPQSDGSTLWQGVVSDITERKLDEAVLQQSRQRLEAIISASPDGIGIITLDGKMQFLSDKLIQMYGYSVEEKDELIGRPAFDFIDPSDHNRLKENLHKLRTGQSDHKIREYLAIKKDNSRFYIELNYNILPDPEGNPASILFVERDSTERKIIEEETAKINLELAELNATKDKFFSIIAHDLKSPFQGLIGCSQILSSEYTTLSEDEKMSFIGSIEELSRNSYKLLENLLDWSRMQTGQMIINMEDFNLLVELYPTISLVKQTAKNKKIELNYMIDNSIFVKADKNMLSTVVRNLAANAIKFTNPGGRIMLEARKSDSIIEVSVTDTGIGIEQDIMGNLFKIDKSVSKKGTANEQGTGLGLLLCKEMIDKHGGKIRVESKVGQGSTFSFTIASA